MHEAVHLDVPVLDAGAGVAKLPLRSLNNNRKRKSAGIQSYIGILASNCINLADAFSQSDVDMEHAESNQGLEGICSILWSETAVCIYQAQCKATISELPCMVLNH